jgi:DNA invertase Pin-like site-specific DNA recombinase
MKILKATGCERLFMEEASGGQADLPKLTQAIESLQPGDVFVIWKLDCLSRSLRDLAFTVDKIEKRGVGLLSVTETIDTTTPTGSLMIGMLCAFAEFEPEMISERTLHGLENARRAGCHIGRKPKVKPTQKAEIVRMIEEGRGSAAHAASLFNVYQATVTRVLQAHRGGRAA